jgi:carbonic anhydrase
MKRYVWIMTLALVAPVLGEADPAPTADVSPGYAVSSIPSATQDHGVASTPSVHETTVHPAPAPMVSPAEVLLRLRDGNTRFVAGMSQFRQLDSDRRCDTYHNGQQPLATILSCSDSRVPVEHLFDAGVGELFVIRVAGNIATPDGIASIEYASGHLGSNVVVVMGHTRCGAVTAALDHTQLEGHLPKLIEQIMPAVDAVRSPSLERTRQIDRAVESNVRLAQRRLIEQSEEIKRLVSLGTVEVHGAIYDLHNGIVLWLGPHPQQSELLGGVASSRPIELLTDHRVASTEAHTPASQYGSAPSHATPVSSAAPKSIKPPASGDSHASAQDVQPALAADNAASLADAKHADAGHKATASDPNASAAEKHGLIVPAAFMLGGVALSTGILFALRSRRAPVVAAA